MIKKVLIAEDHETANISIQKTLEDLGVNEPEYAFYCDDVLAKIQKALSSGWSFDLLITDLYFEQDGRIQKISNGMELICAVREVQPELRILVFSAEHRPVIIKDLYDVKSIDGYVRKARNDAKELKQAITVIQSNQRYFPRHLMQLMQQKNTHQFTDYDITIITLLAQGMRQRDIEKDLKQRRIQPSGLSSLEKRLKLIRETLNFSTNEQLIAYCKDEGVI
jgi:two-component system, NarL family, captular synthesis response regulator RcsB